MFFLILHIERCFLDYVVCKRGLGPNSKKKRSAFRHRDISLRELVSLHKIYCWDLKLFCNLDLNIYVSPEEDFRAKRLRKKKSHNFNIKSTFVMFIPRWANYFLLNLNNNFALRSKWNPCARLLTNQIHSQLIT